MEDRRPEQDQNAEDMRWKEVLAKQLRRKEAEPSRELTGLSRAFVAPLTGRGLSVLIIGAVLIRIGSVLGLIGTVLLLLVYSYVMQVIAFASHGRDSLPPWKVEDLWGDVFQGLKFVGIVIAAFLPAIVLLISSVDLRLTENGLVSAHAGWMPVVFILLLLAGAFSLPTMLLVGSISGSFIKALNPLTVLQVVSSVFFPYLLVFMLCILSLAGITVANHTIKVVLKDQGAGIRLLASFASTAVSFYSLLAMGFMVGRFFYCKEDELF